ncbi:MAG: CinA family protein [Clostridia bacterium]|nr:CinA family protein [Clostridia bacterium]
MKVGIITVSNSEIISSEKNNSLKLISSQLYKNGFDVLFNQTLKMDSAIIKGALAYAKQMVDFIFFVSDTEVEKSCLCKKIICDEFSTKLVNSSYAKKNIEEYVKNQNISLKKEDTSYMQIPEMARCIKNPLGIFQGFLMEREGKSLFFLPIADQELRHMFFSSVFPFILQKTTSKTFVFKTYGLKHNKMQLILKDLIKNKHNIDVVCNEYLLSGEVLISVPEKVKENIYHNFISTIYSKILPYIYSDTDCSLTELIYNQLSVRREKLVFAEDFTCGKMANLFCESVENARDVLVEGYIALTNNSKVNFLGVDGRVFKNPKIDLGEVAYQMALGALERSGADVVVANCGDLQSGEVIFALGNVEGIHIFSEKVYGTREQKIAMAANAIFFRLSKKIKQNDFHLLQTTV